MRDYLKADGIFPQGRIGHTPLHNASDVQLMWNKWSVQDRLFTVLVNRDIEMAVLHYHRIKNAWLNRALCVRLWNDLPDHEQHYVFLSRINFYPILFPADLAVTIRALAEMPSSRIETDQAARREWRLTYARLREEFWNDPRTTDEQRATIFEREARQNLVWQLPQESNPSLVSESFAQVIDLATVHGRPESAADLANRVVRSPNKYHVDDDALSGFLEQLEKLDDPMLDSVIEVHENYARLRETPFQLVAETMHGEPFDLADLRGKIVLLDHWSTGCASCIEAMPGLHDTYLQYKDRGFAVVSIVYDGTEARKRVLRIEDQLGLTWTSVNGEGLWEGFAETYGYQGFPQYTLLGRDGTFIAGTAEVDMGRNLPQLLEEIFVAEAAARETGTETARHSQPPE